MTSEQERMQYTCSDGETFDSVALLLYGDEKYACDLLCANPQHCLLMKFRGGEELTVPVITVPDGDDYDAPDAYATAPPWKE